MRTYSFKVYTVLGVTVIAGAAAAVTATHPRADFEPAAERVAFATPAVAPAAAPAPSVADAASLPLESVVATGAVSRVARSAAAGMPTTDASFWAGRKLIRAGELRILVTDVRKAVALADSVGRQHGALLSGSHTASDAQSSRAADLQFRVPADRFTETVDALRAIGDVRNENVSTQDITKDYADLDTRLRVKDETVTRLRSLLATHTAKLGDVLQVEQELARAVTELEQLKGEERYYDQQVAMSSLSVSLFEQIVVPPRASFIDPIVVACRHALEVLGTSLAGVVYGVVFILPWLLLATILWWIFTLVRPAPVAIRRDRPE
ncbi:MAG TPA: DUF4349 domain-containing protein [Gemmatimonadaceae bacterium]|jgi:hypothetical protein